MAGDLGIDTEERLLTIEELVEGIESESVTEAFGSGTAAVISPVGAINYDEKEYTINKNKTGQWTQKFFDTLTSIQYGTIKDRYSWIYRVN